MLMFNLLFSPFAVGWRAPFIVGVGLGKWSSAQASAGLTGVVGGLTARAGPTGVAGGRTAREVWPKNSLRTSGGAGPTGVAGGRTAREAFSWGAGLTGLAGGQTGLVWKQQAFLCFPVIHSLAIFSHEADQTYIWSMRQYPALRYIKARLE